MDESVSQLSDVVFAATGTTPVARDPITLTAYAAWRGVSVKSVSRAVAVGRLGASVGRDEHGRPTILDPDLADREWDANTRARIEYSMPSADGRISLRDLARSIGVNHSALSAAIHDGTLQAGIAFDHRRRAVVVDAAAAEAQWRETRSLRIDYQAKQHASDAASDATASVAGNIAAPQRTATPPREMSEYYAARSAREASDSRRAAAKAEIAEIEVAAQRGQLVRIADVRAGVEAKLALVRTSLLAVPSRVAQAMPDLAARIVPEIEAAISEALEELADTDVVSP